MVLVGGMTLFCTMVRIVLVRVSFPQMSADAGLVDAEVLDTWPGRNAWLAFGLDASSGSGLADGRRPAR